MASHERLFVNAHQAGPNALRLAASLGVGGVRIDANWPDLQPSLDQWTWEWLDDLLATCQSLNLESYCTINQTPLWTGVSDRGELPPYYDWTRFCTEFAQHFKGRLTYVSCWNEPQFPVEIYLNRLLRPFSEAFKRVDAGYQICAPDLQTSGYGWPDWLREFLSQGRDLIDILTFHAYASDADTLWNDVTRARPRFIPSWWPTWPKPSIKQIVDRYGPHDGSLRCWLTECGFKSAERGETWQATETGRLLQKFLAAGWPQTIHYFQLLDEHPPGQDGVDFGLFRDDHSIKPSGMSLKMYAQRPSV